MVKVTAPLLSLRAHGWFGGWMYGYRGVVKTPYPIGLFHWVYGHKWEGDTWSSKKARWTTNAKNWWGIESSVFVPFLSFYYSPTGWCYQRRRTWHGCISIAERPPIGPNPQTEDQQANRMKIKYGVIAWQGMNPATKDYYNRLSFPRRASGYNRFLHYYLLGKPC